MEWLSTTLCTLCYHFVRQWHYILIQSNLHLAKETDCTALFLLQQIKTDSHYRKADTTPTIQYHHCMTETGNVAHVDCGIYIISEWYN